MAKHIRRTVGGKCKHGHILSKDNIILSKDNYILCRECTNYSKRVSARNRKRGITKDKLTIEKIFLMNVDFSKKRDGCWNWIGTKHKQGYGLINAYKRLGVPYVAHRAIYEHFVKQVDKKKDLHHKCLNPACVNPFHMEELSRRDHLSIHGKLNSDKTHCSRGHEFNLENTGIAKLRNGKKGRFCRICKIITNRKWYLSTINK